MIRNGQTAAAARRLTLFALRSAAFAASILFGAVPLAFAQVVPSGAHAPGVINTANGIQQVNITKPSGAGVSTNTYSQFDVPKAGVILNNSPVLVQTQQAGYINGNPNFGANDAAKIIVNQVNSNSPSQLRGYVEVAGQKADVVIANGSGIVVDGGGFINTSRGILTTGNPLFDASGNLTGFNVTGGTITVQGAGFNASNIDEVDLIARAVQANAAIYANTLNVVTGANHVDYASLNATPVAGTGAAPGVSIDVSQLGGMYANRITLVGTENGVGVNNAGIIAAQAGDLTLTSAGQLVQSGQMNASGNLAIHAASVDNSGTTYAQQSVSLNTPGALTNEGTLAAQQNLTATAGSVASTGLLGAGMNSDGGIGSSGNLSVTSAGLLSATGQNVAPGSATLYGVSLDLSNAQTWAGTALALTATGGDLSLVNATTGAGSSITANAATTLDNSGGDIEANQLALGATDLLNHGGTITQYGASPMSVEVSKTLDNSNGGTLQTNSTDLTLAPATLDNDGGTILDAGTGTLTIAPGSGAGSMSNAGGQIIAAGQIAMQAGSLNNANGVLAAQGNLAANVAGDVNNTQGAIRALSSLSLASGGALTTTNGQIQSGTGAAGDAGDASTLAIQAASLDNTGGLISNLGTGSTTVQGGSQTVNRGGVLTGNGNVTLDTSALSNTQGGQLSGANVALQAHTVDNSGGAIGTLAGSNGNVAITTTGALTNTNGQIGATHDLSVNAATLLGGGAYSAADDVTVNVQGDFALTSGFQFDAGNDLALTLPGAFTNAATLEAANDLDVNASDIANSGAMMAGATLTTHSNTLENTGAMVGGSVSLNATQALTNRGSWAPRASRR